MQTSLFERESPSTTAPRPMREYQGRALEAIREAIREGHKRIVLQCPTGAGKTRIAAEIIQSGLSRGRRSMFTCPAVSLIDQTVKSFKREGIWSIGVMQADHPETNPYAPVQVASIHTLVKREVPDVHFCIVDEVHESREDFDAILDSEGWKDMVVIGLSATPWKRGMGLRWTKLIIGATIGDMIAEAWLSPFIAYVPEHQIDRSKLKVAQGEFTEGSAADAMSVATIVGDAVKEWQEKWGQGKTFMFCVNRNHAKVQMDAFNEAGIACGYIDAFTELDERRRIFKKLADGELKVIASVGCLVRGIDEDVRCVLDLAPTKSIIRHVQKIGRGLRPAEGKERLVIIDCAGNSVALGLVTEIFHDHLDMRKPAERGEAYKDDPKPAKPRKCPKCRTLIPPGLRACPSCQEKLPVHSNVTVMDGRLVEITAGSRKAAKERQDFYSGLLYYARKGNLKDGWAAYRYKERFGDWPKGLRVRGKQPSDEVKAFVTAQRREYLAAKKGAVSA